jgi:four helix bundle protein
MRRCAVSVPSNIAEGAERTGDRDSAQFFVVAKGSLAELQTQAEIAMEVGLMTQTAATEIIEESAEIARMLGAIIHRLKKQ